MPSAASLANLKRPWRRGESGNAAGKHPSYRECQRLCRQHAPDAARVLIELMHNPEAPPHVRALAANSVWNHAWPPREHVELNGEGGIPALRIEFVTAPQHTEREAIEGSAPRVIDAIELDSTESSGK